MDLQYVFNIYTSLITFELFFVTGIFILIFYLALLMYWQSFCTNAQCLYPNVTHKTDLCQYH